MRSPLRHGSAERRPHFAIEDSVALVLLLAITTDGATGVWCGPQKQENHQRELVTRPVDAGVMGAPQRRRVHRDHSCGGLTFLP